MVDAFRTYISACLRFSGLRSILAPLAGKRGLRVGNIQCPGPLTNDPGGIPEQEMHKDVNEFGMWLLCCFPRTRVHSAR